MDSKRLLVIIVVVSTIILTAIGSVGYIMWQRQQPATNQNDPAHPTEETKKEEPKGPPILFEINDLLCMLKTQPGTSAMLSVSLNLDLTDEKEKEELKPYLPIIIDTFIRICGEHTMEEVSGPKGQLAFKTEIQKQLNVEFKKRIEKEPIRDILYNKYIMSEPT